MTAADISIIIAVAVITIVDVILVILSKKTISNRFRFWGQQTAAPFFLWGVLGGHFVGDITPIVSTLNGILILVGALVAVTGGHMLAVYFDLKPKWWFGLIYLGSGVVMGLYFWPQG